MHCVFSYICLIKMENLHKLAENKTILFLQWHFQAASITLRLRLKIKIVKLTDWMSSSLSWSYFQHKFHVVHRISKREERSRNSSMIWTTLWKVQAHRIWYWFFVFFNKIKSLAYLFIHLFIHLFIYLFIDRLFTFFLAYVWLLLEISLSLARSLFVSLHFGYCL